MKKDRDIGRLKRLASYPRYVRAGAAAVFACSVAGIIIAFLITERPSPFRMKSFPTRLSEDVVAVVDGYERRGMYGNGARFYVKADRATTYKDNHQELQNVYLEVFGGESEASDRMTAERAVYLPATDGGFKVFFSGDVDVLTRHGLKVRTSEMSYDRGTETVEAEDVVEFEREEVVGKATGATLEVAQQRLSLLSDVHLKGYAKSGGELADNDIESFKATGGAAVVDLLNGIMSLSKMAAVTVSTKPRRGAAPSVSKMSADSVNAFLQEKEVSRVELAGTAKIDRLANGSDPRWLKAASAKATAHISGDVTRMELVGSAEVRTAAGNAAPTVVQAESLVYDRGSDRFEGKGRVRIVTEEASRPAVITAAEAVYGQAVGRIRLTGGGTVSTATETLTAKELEAMLRKDRSLGNASAKGGATLLQKAADRINEVAASELAVSFDATGNLERAEAKGAPSVVLRPLVPASYSSARLGAGSSLKADFGPGGVVRAVNTVGRTALTVAALAGVPGESDKSLTADSLMASFSADGKHITKAEASGNAELIVDPKDQVPGTMRTTVTAPRLDCGFFEGDNAVRRCEAGIGTRSVRRRADGRGPDQILTSERLEASFLTGTKDLEFLEASGSARFSEADRTGTAARIRYAAATGLVELRGGQPLLWDSRSRARAREIDVSGGSADAFLRGAVSATYFNQSQAASATPFSQQGSPIYVTSDSASFVTARDSGMFSGDARAWQGRNFINAENIEIFRAEKRMTASGNVRSSVLDARPRSSGASSVPVFGTAQKLSYDANRKTVVYEGQAELRQGGDRIAGEKLTAFLGDSNDIERAVAEGSVSVTQPGRRASGEFAEYSVRDERVVLRGNPARVADDKTGSSEASELTVNLRDRSVVGEGSQKADSSGRTRTVYKVNRQR